MLIGFHFAMPKVLPLSVAITLGAIAAATAPAATLMVVKQYKAKGPVTSILLPVVALDDAVGLVLFAISFGVARSLESGSVNILSVVLEPALEVIGSLALGALMGFLFNLTERVFHSRSKRMAVSVTFVLLTVALSKIEIPIAASSESRVIREKGIYNVTMTIPGLNYVTTMSIIRDRLSQSIDMLVSGCKSCIIQQVVVESVVTFYKLLLRVHEDRQDHLRVVIFVMNPKHLQQLAP